MLAVMKRARAIDLCAASLYRQGKITGGCYTGVGNEATSVGTAWALAEGDVLVPTHRDLGSHLVRGHTSLDVLRQFLGRATSHTGGKDGGLHLGREGTGIVGMISHLGHMLPVAAGIALADRRLGKQTCVLTTIGDGATSMGDFHETLNFAAIQRLPILFVIVNNQYAYSTPVTIQYACPRLSDRAAAYGIFGEQVDGTDVIAVLAASRRALARARAGEGPTLLESVTMRMRGHAEHDDQRYVPAELLEAWRAWDPIARLERALPDESAEIARLGAAIDRELRDALERAAAEPTPDPGEAGRGVYRVWDELWTVPEGPSW